MTKATFHRQPRHPNSSTIPPQCTREDSNLHTLRYRNLNPARLPVPPLVRGPARAGPGGGQIAQRAAGRPATASGWKSCAACGDPRCPRPIVGIRRGPCVQCTPRVHFDAASRPGNRNCTPRVHFDAASRPGNRNCTPRVHFDAASRPGNRNCTPRVHFDAASRPGNRKCTSRAHFGPVSLPTQSKCAPHTHFGAVSRPTKRKCAHAHARPTCSDAPPTLSASRIPAASSSGGGCGP